MQIEGYAKLHYPMEVVESEEGGYFAQYPDLPGCMAQGTTATEAIQNLESAKRSWMEACVESGVEIPLPHELVPEYSGKFVVRLPKSLHRELAVKAGRDGVSLNQYVLHLVSVGLGREQVSKHEQLADVEAIDAAVQRRMRYVCPQMHQQLISALVNEQMEGALFQDYNAALASFGLPWSVKVIDTPSTVESLVRKFGKAGSPIG